MPTSTQPKSRKDKMRSKIDARVSVLDRERSEVPEDEATITRANVRTAVKRNRSYGDVELNIIEPDPNQPRRVDTNSDDFRDLVASVKERGVLQPISVRWVEDRGKFQIISGERRYRAATVAKLESIPVVVREIDDQQKVIDQLVENIQREDMHPLQEARAFQALLEVTGETQKQLAKRIGKSQTYVARTLSLLEKLTTDEQEELERYAPAQLPGKSLILEAFRTSDPKTRTSILRGELTRQEARTATRKAPAKKTGRPKNHAERLKLEKANATVTVAFTKASVSDQEVLDALDEARATVRKRLRKGRV